MGYYFLPQEPANQTKNEEETKMEKVMVLMITYREASDDG
jgi:hypothetical protein